MTGTQKRPGEDLDDGPWYRQFWAWFVLAPLLLVMLAWIPFMAIVLKNADDVVIDNYYREGRMYNMRLEQDQLARELGVKGELFVDAEVGEVLVSLFAVAGTVLPERLLLHLDHPVEADNDLSVTLHRTYPGHYLGQLEHRIQHRWYVRLAPALPPASSAEPEAPAPKNWRVIGELDMSQRARMQFGGDE